MHKKQTTDRFPWPARLLSILAVAFAAGAWAEEELVIQITSDYEAATPIAVVPFHWAAQGAPPALEIADVVAGDLGRSGQFAPLAERDLIERPFRPADINFGTWRRLSADYIVIGEINGDPLEGYKVKMHLVDAVGGDSMLSLVFSARPGGLRYTAHHIADTIYERLLGVPGFFRTRIAYVTAIGEGAASRYSLMVADADGQNPQPIVRSREPLLSPAWAPDGQRLAYVSFESGNSSIFVQELSTGERQQVASFKGINGAPAFSPDGRRLAMALSYSGNPEIYVMDLSSRRTLRLTEHWAIDTEPVWMPDGASIVFTSDRGGKPQLYSVPVNSSRKPTRLTREGEYNARASVAPDGERLALVNGQDNNYRIALLDPRTNLLQIVSDGPLDESPSFAPNGRMVLYASRDGAQGVLSAVPVFGTAAAGRTAHQLLFSEGHIREPAWSPILE